MSKTPLTLGWIRNFVKNNGGEIVMEGCLVTAESGRSIYAVDPEDDVLHRYLIHVIIPMTEQELKEFNSVVEMQVYMNTPKDKSNPSEPINILVGTQEEFETIWRMFHFDASDESKHNTRLN